MGHRLRLSCGAIPRELQGRVVLIGIMIALVLRGALIAVGAVLISTFSWVFYLFGLFLVITAWRLAREKRAAEDDSKEPGTVALLRRFLPVSEKYNGTKMTIRIDGKKLFTPMFAVILALGVTDVLFALDSIPAIFGLTKEPFLVFTANAFALLGLSELYFLLGALLQRLVYLLKGLALILGFIGVKLIFEALARRLSAVHQRGRAGALGAADLARTVHDRGDLDPGGHRGGEPVGLTAGGASGSGGRRG